MIPSTFKGNGCTLFPDGKWGHCCRDHDFWYATGLKSRREADKELRDCVREGGRPIIAWLMYAGVRVFGGSFYRG